MTDLFAIAGTSKKGFSSGPALQCQFNSPSGLAVDARGVIYVADTKNHCVRMIALNGVVSVLAGNHLQGFIDDQGSAARFNCPQSLAVHREGFIIVADTSNDRIRKVTFEGLVTTLAGETEGCEDGQGVLARFRHPTGVAVDQHGDVIVADSWNRRICKVTMEGNVTTLLTLRGWAKFSYPVEVAVDCMGNIWVLNSFGWLTSYDVTRSTSTSYSNGCRAVTANSQGCILVEGHHVFCASIKEWAPLSLKIEMLSLKDPDVTGLAVDSEQNLLMCRDNSIYKRMRHDFVRGPDGSPFAGGLFELGFSASSCLNVRFIVPIFHCNVHPKTGHVGFAHSWSLMTSSATITSAVTKLLQCPDVSPQAIQNQEAFRLWKENRLKYNARAREETCQSWRTRLNLDATSAPNALKVLLPNDIHLDRESQLQIYSRLALQELEKYLKESDTQACLIDPEHKFNHSHFDSNIVLVASMVRGDVRAAEAELLRQKLKVQTMRSLEALGVIKLENPMHVMKMEWLERKLIEFFLMDLAPSTPSTLAVSAPPSINKVPTTLQECFALLVTEATKEQLRLIKLLQTCLEKYQLLYARFDMLKRISFEEEKDEVAQPVKSSPEYYIAQAKLLEPQFRSALLNLADSFNREEMPAAVANLNVTFTRFRMTSGQHVKVIFGPSKSAARVLEKVLEKGLAYRNCDYLRATVIMADPMLLALFYFVLAADTANFKVRQVKNKHNLTELNQPPNLHVNFDFRGHILEVQFILEDFFLIKGFMHKPYEVVRVGKLQGESQREAIARLAVQGVYMKGSNTE